MKNIKLALFCLILVAVSAHCQTTTDQPLGLIPYQTFSGSDFDKVNVRDGLLNFDIPLFSYPQRGSTLKLSYSLRYNSKYYGLSTFCDPMNPSDCNSIIAHSRVRNSPTQHSPNSNVPMISGFAFVNDQWVHVWPTSYNLWYDRGAIGVMGTPEYSYVYAEYQLMTSDGALHPTNSLYGTTDNKYSSGPGTMMTLDGTGYRLDSAGVHDRNGVIQYGDYVQEDADGNYIINVYDANGNMTGVQDSMGRIIPNMIATGSSAECTGSLPVTSVSSWSVPGANNGTQTFTFCYASAPAYIPSSYCWNVDNDLNTTQTVLQSIVLPNHQTWTFEYQARAASDPATVYYGEVSKITMPSGGTISYEYAIDYSVCSAMVTKRTVSDGNSSHSWTYQENLPSPNNSSSITDPDGNVTLTTFNNEGYEASRKEYSGSSALLKETDTTYLPDVGPITPSEQIGAGISNVNRLPSTITTILDDGSVSKKILTYCCDYPFSSWTTSDGWYNGGGQITASYGIQTDEKDYDFGTGTPGSLLRETSTTFAWQSNSAYQNANLLETPTTTEVLNGSGQIVSRDDSTYDEQNSVRLPSGVLGTNQLASAPPSSVYGHVTTKTSWLNGGSGPVSHMQWYDTGELSQSSDPLGNSTTYEYGSAYIGALPTKVTNAVGDSTQFTYDFNSGQKASATDANNQTTTWNYDDFGRMITETGPTTTAGQPMTSICYDDFAGACRSDSPQNAIVKTTALSSGTAIVQERQFDGLDRATLTRLLSDPAGVTYTRTTYDSLGRAYQVWNPTRCNPMILNSCSGEGTSGITTHLYDPLGRPTSVQNPGDGTAKGWQYTGATTTTTDEDNHQWTRTSDALGRLVQVKEPNGSGNSPSLETDYQYDAMGNLLSVSQQGNPATDSARSRSFIYDSLSRLISAANPEVGLATYSYQLAGGGLCAGDQSSPCSKTDARGVTTNYSYDNVNRLVAKTYTNDSAGTPNSCWLYGVAAPGTTDPNPKERLTAEWTQAGACSSSGPSASALTWQTFSNHDAMGRVQAVQQCPYGVCTSPFSFSYTYDLVGDVTSQTNGAPNNGILLSNAYDGAGHLQGITSSWDDVQHPSTLFQANTQTASSMGVEPYTPTGVLAAAQFGIPSGSGTAALTQMRMYDPRLRILSEVDAGLVQNTPASPSAGAIAISGAEQTKNISGAPATAGIGSVSIGGTERSITLCGDSLTQNLSLSNMVSPQLRPPPCQTTYDSGTVSITVGTFVGSASYSKGSTWPSIAAALGTALNVSSSPVTAVVSGAVITMTARSQGVSTNYNLVASVSSDDPDDFPDPSFRAGASGSTLTGGQDAGSGTTIYDSGTLTVSMSDCSASQQWGQTDTSTSIAVGLQQAIQANCSGRLSATVSGSVVSVTSNQSGSTTNWPITPTVTYDTGDFSASSFSVMPVGMSGGTDAVTGNGTIYSYTVPSTGGYDGAGNVLQHTDLIMGTWSFGYDTLNRLTSGTGLSGPYTGQNACWSYDSFGNRTGETVSPTACASLTTASTWASFNTNNQLSGTNTAPAGYAYDGAGDVGNDGVNQYLYDAEGRLCAVYNTSLTSITGYVYNADGLRTAKGGLSSFSCASGNGFYVKSKYLLGMGGEQVTELNGTDAWQHSNVYAAGKLLATYDNIGLHFHFTDPLGTKRVQSSASGFVEQTCLSFPFGNGPDCVGATEHRFTGKERDAESELDYFGARYYNSGMGRWMSPDWSAKAEPIPYAKLGDPQSLNLYAYVSNNPLRSTDPDGHKENSDPCANQKGCSVSHSTVGKQTYTTTTVTVNGAATHSKDAAGNEVITHTETKTSVTVNDKTGEVSGGRVTSSTVTTTWTQTPSSLSSSTTTVQNVDRPLSVQEVGHVAQSQAAALSTAVTPTYLEKHGFQVLGIGLAGGAGAVGIGGAVGCAATAPVCATAVGVTVGVLGIGAAASEGYDAWKNR